MFKGKYSRKRGGEGLKQTSTIKTKLVMKGKIDCIMHSSAKKITPSRDTKNVEGFPKEADVGYSKIWIVLEGSDSENPWWLEIDRPMIPQCEWQGSPKLKIGSGDKIRVTLEILSKGCVDGKGDTE